MLKIVINTRYGGFSLSKAADALLAEYSAGGDPFEPYGDEDHKGRDNKHLVRVVEELGEAAAGRSSALKIVEIPDDVQWTIEDDDGVEWVAEVHRTWN